MGTYEDTVVKRMEEAGAVLEGHFVLASGRHTREYINKDGIYQHPGLTSSLCFGIASKFVKDGIDVVVGPVTGGVILSQWTSHWLWKIGNREVLAAYADRIDKNFVIRRRYAEIISNRNILIVEDILTTGGSAKKVIEAVRLCKGRVVGLGALWNRGGVSAEEIGSPLIYSLVNRKLKDWPASQCPLCKEGIPINKEVGRAG